MKKNKTSKGFTLIELLVVIAIIGILSSVVLASLNTARKKSRDAKRIADMKQVQLALELYFDSNDGAYPAALNSLATTYIPNIPTDPTGNTWASNAYAYCYDSTNKVYHLGAYLEDNTNPALDSDSDKASDGCSSGSFHGNAANCTGATGAGTDQCYDLIP